MLKNLLMSTINILVRLLSSTAPNSMSTRFFQGYIIIVTHVSNIEFHLTAFKKNVIAKNFNSFPQLSVFIFAYLAYATKTNSVTKKCNRFFLYLFTGSLQ